MAGPEDARRMFHPSIGFGRGWILPHAVLFLLCVILPIVRPDIWEWWTAVGGGLFFGGSIVVDVLVMRAATRLKASGLLDPGPREMLTHSDEQSLPPHRRGHCPRCGRRLRVPIMLVMPNLQVRGTRVNCPECSLLLRPSRFTLVMSWLVFGALFALGFAILGIFLRGAPAEDLWPFVGVTFAILVAQALAMSLLQDFEPVVVEDARMKAT